jgi:tetratricopeptide (TPR) repeat protein
MRLGRCCLIATALAALAGAAAADPPPAKYPDLVDRPYAIVQMANGREEQCIEFKQLGNGSLEVKFLSEKESKIIPRAQWVSYEEPRTWAESLTKRGQMAIARADYLEIERVLAAGNKRGETVRAQTLDLARRANERWPENTRVAKVLVDLLVATGDKATAKTTLRATLTRDRLWRDGWMQLVEMLKEEGDQAAITAIADELLRYNPTDREANSLAGPIREAGGDLQGAEGCYQKLATLHHVPESARDWARILLRRGKHQAAIDALVLATGDALSADAACIRGSAMLALATADAGIDAARTELQRGLGGQPSPAVAPWAQYNLGLSWWRQGKVAEAQQAWTTCQLPAAQLGLAMAAKQTFRGAAGLAEPLRSIALEHNACIDLMSSIANTAGLDAKRSPRQAFLVKVAEMLGNPASQAAVEAVGVDKTPEALRWQAYGHILVKRWSQAEAILAALPADDGYAATYRILAALGRNDKAAATALLPQLEAARNPPAPAVYASRLRLALQPQQSDDLTEEFDTDAPDAARNGWQLTGAPGIAASIAGGRLLMGGPQPGTQDPTSRLWRLVGGERLSSVQSDLDLSGIGNGLAGIEVLDDGRSAGAGLAVQADGKLVWRELKAGTWGAWTPLNVTVQGTQIALRIDYNGGRLTAVTDRGQFPLGDGLPRTAQAVAIGIFGQADPGTTWQVAAERIRAEYRKR